MPESTVQWRKENLRYGLVELYSTTYVLFKSFDKVKEETHGLHAV